MDVIQEYGSPATSDCENCSATVPNSQKFCSHCSFPANGSDSEKQSFRLHVSSRKRFLSDAQDKIKSSKYIMFGLAGIFLVVGLLVGFGADDFETMVINIFCCIVYLILAAWCSKNPFGATLTALIIYATLVTVNAFVEPTSLFSGIFLKIIVVVCSREGYTLSTGSAKIFGRVRKIEGHSCEWITPM